MQIEDVEDLRGVFARLRRDLADLRWSLLERKYSPDQPRVPAGSSDGGRWADGAGPDTLQTEDDAPVLEDAAQRIPGPYQIDLRQEEAAGGHGFDRHVGKSENQLRAMVAAKDRELGYGKAYELQPQGSFDSLETANRLTNATLEMNRSRVGNFLTG